MNVNMTPLFKELKKLTEETDPLIGQELTVEPGIYPLLAYGEGGYVIYDLNLESARKGTVLDKGVRSKNYAVRLERDEEEKREGTEPLVLMLTQEQIEGAMKP